MPVDTTYRWEQPCDDADLGEHYYDVWPDGEHSFTCHCGRCVVLPHDTKLALRLSQRYAMSAGVDDE